MVPKDAHFLLPRTCDNDIWMADGILQIQAYLILLQSILLWFTAIAFFFFQIEGLKVCTPVSSKSIVLFLQHLLTFCHILVVVAVQLLSCVQFFATPWTAARQASLSFTISQSLLKLMSIESMMPSSHLILCCPLLFLPSIFPSIKVVSSELSLCIRHPKYWSFSFSISPSNDYSELISFRLDWLDLFAVQGTLKSLLQHHSSKASLLRHSSFFIVQLSHPYLTTGKTVSLTRQTFVGKEMSLLFNMMSRFIIAFFTPRSKCFLISWMQSQFTVIFGAQENKICQFPLFPHLFAMKW